MKRLPMRKVREALRLRANGLTLREIAESLGLGRTTIGDHLQRAARAGLTWPLDDVLTDAEMDALLFPPPSGVAATIAQPDRALIHRELKRQHVMLTLLLEEYRAAHPAATAIAVSATSIASGKGVCRRRCVNTILLVSPCLSTAPAQLSM